MKKYRPQLFFAAAVVIGLITSLLAMGWLRNAELRHVAEAAMPVVTTAEVVVAKADLAWGTKLTPEMLQVVNYPAGALPDGYYKSVDDLTDAVLLNDLKANEVILRSKLASGKDVAGDMAAGFVLDAVASVSADLLTDRLACRFRARVPGEGTAVLGYSPGYCGWHISGQRKLFERLGPDDLGIRLNDSFLMQPLKSVSGVLVAGAAAIHRFRPEFGFCAECTTRLCLPRMRSVR